MSRAVGVSKSPPVVVLTLGRDVGEEEGVLGDKDRFLLLPRSRVPPPSSCSLVGDAELRPR